MDEDPPSDISSIDITSTETPPKCTTANCFVPDKANTLKCSMVKCSRLVHFKCSKLPAYQVQIHLNNQTLKRNKATFVCSNCVDISKDIESLCMESDQENLKNIIHERDRSIKDYQKKVKILKTKNKSLENESYNVDDFEKKIKEQIDTLGESIKTSILQEIQPSLTKVEDQVTEVKTYASATKASTPNGLKTIVKEARYEEMKEKRDHDNRSKNIIIHGVTENTPEQTEIADRAFVDTLIETIKIPKPNMRAISRIGTQATDKKRPIKVVLVTEKEKMTVLRNLSALKDNEEYKGISITEDLTPTERSVLKEWTEKAKNLNSYSSAVVHRVRGDSKNGY
ncbi:uncharacterized protein PF3D7_1120000-like [Clytia hemisphaerica]|uniref:uncharacterized protein PF3D7_1120000-like n=1 Tax=Clytia hemisphaerica TaxID=252671 RepID=UPI0034D51683